MQQAIPIRGWAKVANHIALVGGDQLHWLPPPLITHDPPKLPMTFPTPLPAIFAVVKQHDHGSGPGQKEQGGQGGHTTFWGRGVTCMTHATPPRGRVWLTSESCFWRGSLPMDRGSPVIGSWPLWPPSTKKFFKNADGHTIQSDNRHGFCQRFHPSEGGDVPT